MNRSLRNNDPNRIGGMGDDGFGRADYEPLRRRAVDEDKAYERAREREMLDEEDRKREAVNG